MVGHDVGVQTEAHVFIANFIHDANDEQLVAASGALSAIDFNRLAAAGLLAQHSVGYGAGRHRPCWPGNGVEQGPPGGMPPATWLASPIEGRVPRPRGVWFLRHGSSGRGRTRHASPQKRRRGVRCPRRAPPSALRCLCQTTRIICLSL